MLVCLLQYVPCRGSTITPGSWPFLLHESIMRLHIVRHLQDRAVAGGFRIVPSGGGARGGGAGSPGYKGGLEPGGTQGTNGQYGGDAPSRGVTIPLGEQDGSSKLAQVARGVTPAQAVLAKPCWRSRW